MNFAAQHLTPLAYKDGYKYQLAEPFQAILPFSPRTVIANDFCSLVPQDGRSLLTVRKGYAWDGCSGPTIDSRCAMRACFIHDGLYQFGREGHFAHLAGWREIADAVLRDTAIQDGMWEWRAGMWHRAVRIAGAKHNQRPRDVKVIE